MRAFDDIKDFSLLKIMSTSGTEASVFGNGLQQVEIVVQVSPVDENGDYIDLDDAGKTMLNNAISIVDYITGEKLQPVDSDALNSENWSYTKNKNDYISLNSNVQFDFNNTELISENIYTYSLYIMCPPQKEGSAIKLAVSIELNDNTINSMGTDGFDSYVYVTGLLPLLYEIVNIQGGLQPSYSAEKGLLVTKTTGYSRNENYGQNFSSWTYNYYVEIENSQNPNGWMRDKVFYPVGSPSTTSTRPVNINDEFYPANNPSGFHLFMTDYSASLAFAGSCYDSSIGICHIYKDNDVADGKLGVKNYNTGGGASHMQIDDTINSKENCFRFSSVHLYGDPDDEQPGSHTAFHKMQCEFRDQYGNPGVFIASYYNEDVWHRAGVVTFYTP